MGLHHLTRPVYKDTFAWFSDNLLLDSLLHEEEQHYSNSWQMLFPLTFKFLKPFQKHTQKLICLSVTFDSKQWCFDTTGLSVYMGHFYIIQMHTNHKWQKKTFSRTTGISIYKTYYFEATPVESF